jgi:hypothetical protein
LLDGRGQKDLQNHAKGRDYQAVAGVAKIAWKSDEDHAACIADHKQSEKRQKRWKKMKKGLQRMQSGEFPQFAHAYLHPSLTGAGSLMVIDGTRRMLAYLELGLSEMPVVVFRAIPDEGSEKTPGTDLAEAPSGEDEMNGGPVSEEGAKH